MHETAGLPTPDGIDLEQALARTAGRIDVCWRHWRLFHRVHGQDGDQLARLRSTGDSAALRALAHALNGSAGNVGAVGVQTAAAALEQALNVPGETARQTSLTRSLEHELSVVLTSLSRLGDGLDACAAGMALPPALTKVPIQVPTQAPTQAPPPPQLLIDRLAGLLAAGDMASGRLLREQSHLLRPALGDAFDTVAGLVAVFRHDAALEVLQAAAGNPQSGPSHSPTSHQPAVAQTTAGKTSTTPELDRER